MPAHFPAVARVTPVYRKSLFCSPFKIRARFLCGFFLFLFVPTKIPQVALLSGCECVPGETADVPTVPGCRFHSSEHLIRSVGSFTSSSSFEHQDSGPLTASDLQVTAVTMVTPIVLHCNNSYTAVTTEVIVFKLPWR